MGDDVFGLVGRTVDEKVRVDGCIGEGGFAVVYRGFHLAFEQPVALKCLKVPSHFDSDAQAAFLAKFREEGKMLFRLSQHASIVRVFDLGDVETGRGDRIPYLVLEWLDGEDLDAFLKRRNEQSLPALTEKEALNLLRPAVDAIALAHRLGIAHRDLKPSNLLLANTVQGQLMKVLDFGIAKAMQEGETTAQRSTRTSSGFHAFSPQYGAPEQFRSKRFGATGPWTDVHAIGLILTEIVLGRPAMVGEEHGDFYELAVSESRPSPRSLGARVSDAFEALCRRCLARESSDRFQDAEALLAAMDAVEMGVRDWIQSAPALPIPEAVASANADTVSASAITPAVEPGPSAAVAWGSAPSVGPARSRSRWLLAGGGALLVALAAGASAFGWYLPARHQAQREQAIGAMQPVAGGGFRMGADDAAPDQRPSHDVSVAAFALDTTEVTVEAFRLCVQAGNCQPTATVHLASEPDDQVKWNSYCNWDKPDRERHPMNCVDWNQAQAFCAWAGKRLPTEQEWEYVARGGEEQRAFPWGDDKPAPARLNACDAACARLGLTNGWKWKPMHDAEDGWPSTAPVGSFAEGRGRWGHLDLAGNVWEWTSSPFCTYGAKGADSCSKVNMAARGGGWSSRYAGIFRGSFRTKFPREYRAQDVGFRCAR